MNCWPLLDRLLSHDEFATVLAQWPTRHHPQLALDAEMAQQVRQQLRHFVD